MRWKDRREIYLAPQKLTGKSQRGLWSLELLGGGLENQTPARGSLEGMSAASRMRTASLGSGELKAPLMTTQHNN